MSATNRVFISNSGITTTVRLCTLVGQALHVQVGLYFVGSDITSKWSDMRKVQNLPWSRFLGIENLHKLKA